MWLFSQNLTFEQLLIGISAILVVVFLIFPIHEFAHGWVAYKLGDDTAKMQGRLTLSPLDHFDIVGAICLLFVGFGWAKPIPVNNLNFKNPRRDSALVSAAGPLSNVLSAIVGGLFLNTISVLIGGSFALEINGFVYMFVRLNVSLAIFNLIPLPPFDGFGILEGVLPDSVMEKYYKNRRVIVICTFVLVFAGVFSIPLSILENFLTSFIIRIINIPSMIF